MALNYLDFKVSDQRDECKKQNLDATGLKIHLIEPLTNCESEAGNVEGGLKEIEMKSFKIDDEKVDTGMQYERSISSPLIKSTTYNVDSPILTENKELTMFDKSLIEPRNWELRTDVHLDFYNSDLNLVIDSSGFSGQTISDNGFEYLFAGVKANYGLKRGKVYYEVKLVKNILIHLENDVGDSNSIKVGWSIEKSSLALGEELLSFAYDGSGKKVTHKENFDYGVPIKEGDVIGCFLEFTESAFIIRFSVNGIDQGEAFNKMINDLNEMFLLPHILVRNVVFEVNFGHLELFPPKLVNEMNEEIDCSWTLFGNLAVEQRIRTVLPPKSKAECEVLMMCGLPSCGKTSWVERLIKDKYDKFYNVLSTNLILDRMKVTALRKKCASSRWESIIQSVTKCLNKLMEIAVTRRRNFVLDQTNVYPAAQRRRMKTFEEFIRKAIVIVPTDDEYQRRMKQVVTEEGKDVPESAVLQMKENFVIPEDGSDLFNEIIFIELKRSDAESLVKKYNEDAIAQKKTTQIDISSDDDSDNTGLWGASPNRVEQDTKRSRLSTDEHFEGDNRKSRSRSRSRDRNKNEMHRSKSTSSSTHSSRRTDYKGGFCFSREDGGDSTRERGNSRGGRRSYTSGNSRYSRGDRSRGKRDDWRESRRGDNSHRDRNYIDGDDNRRGRDRRGDDRRERGNYGDRSSYRGGTVARGQSRNRRYSEFDDRSDYSYESASKPQLVYGPPSMYRDEYCEEDVDYCGVDVVNTTAQQPMGFVNPYQGAYGPMAASNQGTVTAAFQHCYQTYETHHGNGAAPASASSDYYNYSSSAACTDLRGCGDGSFKVPSSVPLSSTAFKEHGAPPATIDLRGQSVSGSMNNGTQSYYLQQPINASHSDGQAAFPYRSAPVIASPPPQFNSSTMATTPANSRQRYMNPYGQCYDNSASQSGSGTTSGYRYPTNPDSNHHGATPAVPGNAGVQSYAEYSSTYYNQQQQPQQPQQQLPSQHNPYGNRYGN